MLVLAEPICAAPAQSAAPATQAEAAAPTATCNPTTIRAVMSEVENATESHTFVPMKEGAITFVQGGTVPACVIVQFLVEMESTCQMLVRPVLDDTVMAFPPEVALSPPWGEIGARTYTFVYPNVAPGRHVMRMQFHVLNSGEIAIAKRHTILLSHVK